MHHGIATFDLKRFSDTLRASAVPLQAIDFLGLGEESFTFLLLRVQTRWQVANIHVDQHFKEDSRYLNIKWEEDGKGGRRIFRLWPLHVLGGDYIEKAVPDDVCALQIVAPVGQLPPPHECLGQ